MIVNGKRLLRAAPIKGMIDRKERLHGVSFGLSEAGYDIRIKQRVCFTPNKDAGPSVWTIDTDGENTKYETSDGRFTLASAIEEFDMPMNLVGVVHDKSTWARRGLSLFNTVIEPRWKGFLTLELTFHGSEPLDIPAGAGIAQVIFHLTTDLAAYDGKYQGQENRPVEARFE
jgi:dCTP deaminase